MSVSPLCPIFIARHQVQAYADKAAYQPRSPAWWLELQDHKLTPPSESATCRRVLQPFSVRFSATNSSPMLQNASGTAPSTTPATRDLVLQTPRIDMQVDPHEFELLIDIVSTVFLLPPPAIEVLASDWSLVLESENAEVDIIRSAYVDTRQQLVCIQKEAVTMLAMLGAGQSSAVLQPMRARLDSRGSGKFHSTELKVR